MTNNFKFKYDMKQLDVNLMHPAEQITTIIGRIYRSEMTTTSGGNLSIMDENGDMWITPASIDKGSLTPADIICVKADGTIVGPHRPSSEYPFHKAIYKMNPNIHSVVHAHPPGLVTFSMVHQVPDTSILPQAHAVCGPVGFAGYAIPGSELLGQKIVAEFQKNPDYKAVVMENHGVVVAGTDIADAYRRFETLELCARTILNAKTLGEPKYLSDEQIRQNDTAANTPLPHFSGAGHPSDERAIRAEICKIVRRACVQHLMCSSYGTASVRWRGNDFLITPADKQRWDLEPEDIVQVKDGMVEEGKNASRAAALHYEIYRRNPKVNSIILTQSPALMGFCTTGVKFDVRTIPESWIFLQDIPTFPFGSQYDERRTELVDEFKKRPFVMVENDCVIVTGDQLINTFDRLEVADFSARSLILAAPLGKLNPITDDEIEKLRVAFHVGE